MSRGKTLWRMIGVGVVSALVSGSLVAGLVRQERTPSVADVDGSVVARLGEGASLHSGELRQRLQALPADSLAAVSANRALLEQWLKDRLVERALVNEALARDWTARDTVAAAIRQVTEQLVLQDYLGALSEPPEDYPAETMLQQAYRRAAPELVAPDLYQVQQIFIAVTGNTEQAAAQQRADALAERARRTPQAFADLARAESDNPDIDTGLVPLSQLLPAVRAPLAALSPGDITGPVRSEAGLHVLKLVAREPARQLSLEEVAPQLREALRQQYRRDQITEYVETLRARTSLNIDGAALTRVMESLR
jgi:peptidylprolyl isomerase